MFWLENLKGSDHLEDLGVDEKIILECILGKQGGRVWTGCIWLRIGTSGRLNYLSDYYLLKKDSASCS
jgi:hypothetical protein